MLSSVLRRNKMFSWFFENPVWAEVVLGLTAAAWAVHLLFFDPAMFTSSDAWKPLLLMAPQWVWGLGAALCWFLTCISLRLNNVLVKVSSHVMSLMVFTGMSSVLYQYNPAGPGWMIHAVFAAMAALIVVRSDVSNIDSTKLV